MLIWVHPTCVSNDRPLPADLICSYDVFGTPGSARCRRRRGYPGGGQTHGSTLPNSGLRIDRQSSLRDSSISGRGSRLAPVSNEQKILGT